MDDRIVQFRVGVVVLATCIIAVILVMAFQDKRPFGPGTYKLHVPFERAPGIRIGTPVRKSGIRIGEVVDIQLEDKGGVMVTLAIDSRFKVFKNERAQIGTNNILGDAIIEFVPARKAILDKAAGGGIAVIPVRQQLDPEKDVFEPGDTLPEGSVQVNPLELMTDLQGDLRGAIDTFTTAGESIAGAGKQVEKLALTVNGFLEKNRDQINNILDSAELAMDEFSKTMHSVNTIIGDEELAKELRDGLGQLPELVTETRQTINSIRGTAETATSALDSLGGFTAALDEHGSPILESVHGRIAQLGELLDQLTLFGESINSSEGTVGLLLRDKELYERLNRTLENVEEASQKLRPILDDVRIFTDKIARDPGRIGVSGAIQGRSVTK